MRSSRLTFKIATDSEEFNQIHRLNYRTFVNEIPQHPPNNKQSRVDRYHIDNTYYICLDGQKLAGMLAMRSNRPFSLDEKVIDLDSHIPVGEKICELRLLAVDQPYRKPGVFARLIRFAAENVIRQGYTLAIASGTLRQQHLYHSMGFIPFSDPVGPPEARYQPMYLKLHTAKRLLERIRTLSPESPMPISFLPGPVEISSGVRHAFSQPPLSHRSDQFSKLLNTVKSQLRSLTGAAGVELLLGSGTLANDVVAGQLKLLERPGIVLSNGEFGDRLIDHAMRMGLSFETVNFGWGSPYDVKAIESILEKSNDFGWIWTVHCETSTGMLNDLSGLKAFSGERNLLLCLDCTSSLGTVALDLSDVYLASSVSGKGLASYPGLALVYYNHMISSDCRLPRYLDLGIYRDQQGVPFTHSSNLVAALHEALLSTVIPERFDAIRRTSEMLRRQLKSAHFRILTEEGNSSPSVISILLPHELSSLHVGTMMENRGWLLSFRSRYLLERNIIQICLMGTMNEGHCREMFDTFIELASRAEQ